MIVKATLMGMKITEVPTTLSPDGRSRPPHLRPWRDGWRHLRFMLLYSPRWLFLYPGLFLMLAGLSVGAWLTPHARMLGTITLDIHTLFFSAIGALVGFQAILFAIFGKTFAITQGLLPPDRKMNQVHRLFHLESWIVIGTLLVLLGLSGGIYGVMFWERHGFGPLLPTHVMRVAIPSGFSLALGSQIVLSAFFLSLLRMGRR